MPVPGTQPIIRSRKVISRLSQRLLPSTGFSEMVGTATYLVQARKLKILITLVRAPTNKGPSFYVDECRDWRNVHDVRQMREHLEARMDDVASRLQKQSWPAQDVYIEQCRTSGQPLGEFVEKTCRNCTAWYCLLVAP